MVTASHNPKDDNGYKVYWENGAQVRHGLQTTIRVFDMNALFWFIFVDHIPS